VEQSVIHRTITVAPGRFAPGHLGELTQQVPFELVDAALAATGRTQSRLRALPARVVVYLLVAGCLFAELGYVQVWQRLCAGLDGLALATPTASALTQARRRLGPAPLRALFDLLCGPARRRPSVGSGSVGCWCARSTAPPSAWPTPPPTIASTPPSPATTAARAIRCCAWSPWSPAAPAA